MKKLVLSSIFAALLLFLSTKTSLAATYYLSPSGSDNNSGTQSQPWRSLSKAGSSTRAGDVVILTPGVYSGQLNVSNSGSSSAGYIRFVGQDGAIIDGSGSSGPCIRSSNRNYLWYENLEIRDCSQEAISIYGSSETNRATNFVLRGIYAHDNGKSGGGEGIEFENVDTFEITDSRINNNGRNGLSLLNTQNGLIENVEASYNNGRNTNGTADNISDDNDGIVVLNSNTLIFKNVTVTHNGEEGIDIGGWIKAFRNWQYLHNTYDIHIRGLISHDNPDEGIGFSAEAGADELDTYNITAVDVLSYNNGIQRSGASGGMNLKAEVRDVRIAQSVIADDLDNGLIVILDSHDVFLKNNIIAYTEDNDHIAVGGGAYNVFPDYTLFYPDLLRTQWRGTNYLISNPLFISRSGGNYNLQSSSPGISSGGPITTTTNSGSNSNLVSVQDAKYFMGGFGMTEGDLIRIGDEVARVQAVPSGSSLRLDRNISWSNGDWVNFYYEGQRPNRGLINLVQSPQSTPTPTPAPTSTPAPTATPTPTITPTTPPPTATPTPPPPPSTELIEAEDSTVINARIQSEHTGYTGTGYVNFSSSGSSLIFNFNMPNAGTYPLTLRYALGAADRNVEIRINSAAFNSNYYFSSTGAWTNWDTVTFQAPLSQGQNSVEIVTTGSDGPNIDHLVNPATEASTMPGDANSDNLVDGVDYVIWLNNFGKQTSSGPAEGDFDRNGQVDNDDLSIWLNNYEI